MGLPSLICSKLEPLQEWIRQPDKELLFFETPNLELAERGGVLSDREIG